MNNSADELSQAGELHFLSRFVRVVAGSFMIAIVMLDVTNAHPLGWLSVMALVAIYPLLSGIIGWELALLNQRKESRTPLA